MFIPKITILAIFGAFLQSAAAQSVLKTMKRLPDTGQNLSYTSTFGEDHDYQIHMPFLKNNGNGTVTDTITGLMWQKTDGGEMTVENAILYCDSLTLGGHKDWRLPSAQESFSILNHQTTNPALDVTVFTKTTAEYWWTAERQSNDNNRVWITNSGGGIGNHLKTETISAGGTRKIHVRAVRDISQPAVIPAHYTDNADGTVTDNLTGLTWQKVPSTALYTWEQALAYAENLSLAGKSDWRLPNIKEMQSINDETTVSPSVNATFFSSVGIKKYWSSTTLPNQNTKAWYWDTQFGIITYDVKTASWNVICVRGGLPATTSAGSVQEKPSFSIFPNPVSGLLHFRLSGPLQGNCVQAEVTDPLGKVIYRQEFRDAGEEMVMDTENFINGQYYLRLIATGNTRTMKFIVIQ